MMKDIDFAPGATYRDTINAANESGNLVALSGVTFGIYKDASPTPFTTGLTATLNHGGNGAILLEYNFSDAVFSVGSKFSVRCTAGSAGTRSLVNWVVGSFSIGMVGPSLGNRVIPDSYAAAGAQPTVDQALLAVHQILRDLRVKSGSPNVLEVLKPDGSTPSGIELTMDNFGNPTTRTG